MRQKLLQLFLAVVVFFGGMFLLKNWHTNNNGLSQIDAVNGITGGGNKEQVLEAFSGSNAADITTGMQQHEGGSGDAQGDVLLTGDGGGTGTGFEVSYMDEDTLIGMLEMLEASEKEKQANRVEDTQVTTGEDIQQPIRLGEQPINRYNDGGDEYDVFPEPLHDKTYNFAHKGKRPRADNMYSILFTGANSSDDRIFAGEYTLQGAIVDNVEYVEVTRDGDMAPYLLTTFEPGKTVFSYNISTAYGNIHSGVNLYLIRGYAHDVVYERLFSLEYYPFDTSIKHFTEVDKDGLFSYEDPESCQLPVYTIKNGSKYDEYYLEPANYWSYMQTLDMDGYIFEYQHAPIQENNNMQGRMRLARTFADAKTIYTDWVPSTMRCGDFGGYTIRAYDGGYVLFIPSSGHEGNAVELLYIWEQNKIYNIYEDILKPLFGGAAYGLFGVTIENNQLILNEHPYCCDSVMNDGGHEKLIFSLPDLTFISKTPLSERYKGLYKDTYEPLYVPAGALQSSEDLFVREVTDNGYAHITLLGAVYDRVKVSQKVLEQLPGFPGVKDLEEFLGHESFDITRLGIVGGIWSAKHIENHEDDTDRLVIDSLVYQ